MQVKIKNSIEKIARKYRLKLILLFGSRTSGQNHKGSDFDVAYLADKNLNLEEEVKLITELNPVFKSENIDLVNLKKAPPLLLYAITQDPKIIYQKNPLTFYEIRAYAFHLYVESKQLFNLQKELLLTQ